MKSLMQSTTLGLRTWLFLIIEGITYMCMHSLTCTHINTQNYIQGGTFYKRKYS